MSIKETNLFKPYDDKGYCTLRTTGIGVYLIHERTRDGLTCVYVGKSNSDLKKTLYRHFQKWTDRRHPDRRHAEIYERVTYWAKGGFNDNERFAVRVLFTDTNRRADLLEYALIKKYKPRDNTQKLDLYSEVDIKDLITDYKKRKTIKAQDDYTPF